MGVTQQLRAQDEASRGLSVAGHEPWAAEEMSRVSPDQLDSSIAGLEKSLGDIGESSPTDQIAKWLTKNRSLQRLLLRRNHPADVSRIIELAKATLDFILEHHARLDLRVEVYGSSVIADLKPQI